MSYNNSNTSSRKLVLHGSLAQNQIKSLNLRVKALNEQISANNDYARKLEKDVIKKNLELEKLKKEMEEIKKKNDALNEIVNSTKVDYSKMADKASLLYILQA